jgi:hypothetical protein
MNHARLFDGVNESGKPFFNPDHEKLHDEAERSSVASFLRGGSIILRTTGRDIDWIDQERGQVVPLSFRTDGQWIWSEGLAYYVEGYGIAPDDDFLRYVRGRNYIADTPPEEACRQAAIELRDFQ